VSTSISTIRIAIEFEDDAHEVGTMKAVILVGGMGTRLRPLTFSIPKPLLPVGEKPILQIILEQLRAAGTEEVILATGYQAELIQAFCGDGSRFQLAISYFREEMPLGTAGPLSLVRHHFDADEHFLLMNGDILTNLDFGAFVDFSRRRQWSLTVGYTRHVYRSPFGVLSIKNDMLQSIVEKPAHEYCVSAGIYSIKGSALQWIPDREFFTVPDLMRALLAANKPVGCYYIEDCWMGLETVEHFEEALKIINGAAGVDSASRVVAAGGGSLR
jgi:mannose-1-phosphate guanylyltransferase